MSVAASAYLVPYVGRPCIDPNKLLVLRLGQCRAQVEPESTRVPKEGGGWYLIRGERGGWYLSKG